MLIFLLITKYLLSFIRQDNMATERGDYTSVLYSQARNLLNNAGYSNYPLIVIDSLKEIDSKIEKNKRINPPELTRENTLEPHLSYFSLPLSQEAR